MDKIFIKIDDQNNIVYRHNCPFDSREGLGKTETELLLAGKLISMPVPQPDSIEGKNIIEKYDPVNNSIYYEYIDIPKTPEQLLEERVAATEIAIAAMMGGAM